MENKSVISINDQVEHVVNKVINAISVACDKFENGEGFNVQELQALHESIRILHHVKKIKEN